MSGRVLLLLLAPAAGLLVNMLLQAAVSRVRLHFGPIRLQFLSFAAGAVVTLTLLSVMILSWPFTTADRAGYLALHMLIYACFGFCFFNVISANVSSLRVRILREMLAQDPKPMEKAVLRQRYSSRDILLARLARLEGSGQIEARDGRYYLRKGGILLIGKFFIALRRLLLKA